MADTSYTLRDDFKSNNLNPFFEDSAGDWLRFLHDPGTKVVMYYDNNGNIEIYGPSVQTELYRNNIRSYTSARGLSVKTFVNDNVDFEDLKKKRECLYNETFPNIAWLDAMKDIPYNSSCTAYVQALREADVYKGVEVHYFLGTGAASLDVDEFRKFRPLTRSVWMMWGTYRNGALKQRIYTDSDQSIEVYTSDLNKMVPGLPRSDYNLYVKIDENQNPDVLHVARSRLYNHTKSLQASQDQLDDMVERMKGAPGDLQGLKGWDPYKLSAADQLADWTFTASKGIRKLPQFYFNPKPLKKGDPSKPPPLDADRLDTLLYGRF